MKEKRAKQTYEENCTERAKNAHIESKRLVQNKQARNKKENIQKFLKDKK